MQTPEAAQIRFASAVDLCRTRDDVPAHRVELWQGQELLEVWRDETD
ncbi:hypothetical protein [Methylobacterium sp. WSM2598]|nr:hypothetical protein [Methylobacterium sp. WSM2598]